MSDTRHDRVKLRRLVSTMAPKVYRDCSGVQQVFQLESQRTERRQTIPDLADAITPYRLTKLMRKVGCNGGAIRGFEVRLFHGRDRIFDEATDRVRNGQASSLRTGLGNRAIGRGYRRYDHPPTGRRRFEPGRGHPRRRLPLAPLP